MIVIAPTAFKGTVSAAAAAHAMAAGARAVTAQTLLVQPLSDGGPGLIDAFSGLADAVLHRVTVRGPLGDPVQARILVLAQTAIVESADACGLQLVPDHQRNPTVLTTWGVGELIRAASKLSVTEIVIGLGGSATVDGGVGMAAAIGTDGIHTRLTALADVDVPLAAAARVFGPQKGATPQQVQLLEDQLAQLQAQLGVPDFPGAGAAGGLGYGLRAFLHADVRPGSDWVLERTGLHGKLRDAAAIVTGEGRFDEQSFMGKITGTLVTKALQHGVPILVVTGSSSLPREYVRVAAMPGSTLNESDMERLVREHLPALLAS